MCVTGVRNQVASSKSPALAFSGPRDSEPQIGCPPTKRGEPAAAATTLALVDPTSVTVASPGDGEHRGDLRGQLRDRRRDDDEVGAAHGLLERRRRVCGATLDSGCERGGIDVPADASVAAPPRGERDGGAHQAGTDDCDPHLPSLYGPLKARIRLHARQGARRISSARRNARSSDWRAFRRGSSSVW